MRPPDEARRIVAAEWLRKARTDLEAARHLATRVETFPSAVAFHCQQSVEKLLKAFLTWHQVDFPKTHDLGDLLDRVAAVSPRLSAALRDVAILPVTIAHPWTFRPRRPIIRP